MALVPNPDNIRLAMVGMVEGNGHPYSWSAIINGRFDAAEMSRCPYPVIPQYLAAQPNGALGIAGAQVTHICCDNRADAAHVAAASFIPNIVARPTDVIGHVDAVIIPTDKGDEHVARAKPFIDAGLPVFIDKPLVDGEDDLRQFLAWHEAGRAIMSSSCMRYATEFAALRDRLPEVGELRMMTISMCKSWERYGIHALEGLYPFLTPGGWQSATWSGDDRTGVVHLRHESAVDAVILQVPDLYGAFAHLTLYGTTGVLTTHFADTFTAFKSQLEDFIRYLRTGDAPIDFAETRELMTLLIAARRSREEGGRRVFLSELTTS